MRRLCVFMGSSMGANPNFARLAADLGRQLARRGLGVVYGGGQVGLMGVVANAALEEGGEVVGVIPKSLATKELMHPGLSELRVVVTMHERKAAMAELADGFVAIPGGLGTLDELCEILTWAQLGIHRKPCGLLNFEGFFDAFLDHLDRAVRERLLRQEHRDLLMVEREPQDLLHRMAASQPQAVRKWLDLDEV